MSIQYVSTVRSLAPWTPQTSVVLKTVIFTSIVYIAIIVGVVGHYESMLELQRVSLEAAAQARLDAALIPETSFGELFDNRVWQPIVGMFETMKSWL